MYGSGISREGGLLDVGVASDVVRKTGAWFTYGETRLGQGREQSKEFLRANPDIAAAARDGDPRPRWPPSTSRWRASRRPSRCRRAAADARRDPDASRRAPRGRRRRRARRAAVTDAGRRHGGGGRVPGGSAALGRRDARPPSPPRLPGRARRGRSWRDSSTLGYLDDVAFAAAWVESRDRARPRGSLALRQELLRKGVPREAIDEVLAERDAIGSQRDARGRARRAERGPGGGAPAPARAARPPCGARPIRAVAARRPTRSWHATASPRTSAATPRQASSLPTSSRTRRTTPAEAAFDALFDPRVGFAT